MDDPGPDLLEVLRRRHWAVETLTDGELDRDELGAAADVSRTTAGRSLAELERVGVVEETGDGYRLTLYGRVVSEVFERSTARLAGIGESAGVLARLPRTADVDPGLFERSTVYEEAAARERHRAVVRAADTVRGWHRQLALDDVEVYHEQVLAGTTVRAVLDPAFVERLLSDRRELLEAGLTGADVAIREADVPAYSLLLTDGSVCLCVHAEDGVVEGLVETTGDEALGWAEARFESHWADATPLGGV
jgi:predicted transcriptional regulator